MSEWAGEMGHDLVVTLCNCWPRRVPGSCRRPSTLPILNSCGCTTSSSIIVQECPLARHTHERPRKWPDSPRSGPRTGVNHVRRDDDADGRFEAGRSGRAPAAAPQETNPSPPSSTQCRTGPPSPCYLFHSDRSTRCYPHPQDPVPNSSSHTRTSFEDMSFEASENMDPRDRETAKWLGQVIAAGDDSPVSSTKYLPTSNLTTDQATASTAAALASEGRPVIQASGTQTSIARVAAVGATTADVGSARTGELRRPSAVHASGKDDDGEIRRRVEPRERKKIGANMLQRPAIR